MYLGLFKHIMESVEGFLKRYKRQQALDDGRKEILPYPGLSIPKKANREVTQRQGKEIHKLSRCISAVLPSVLRNPNSSQYQDFKSTLKSLSRWLDSLSWPNTAAIHQIHLSTWKGICKHFTKPRTFFLSFSTSKATGAEANRQDWDLRELMSTQHANEACHNTAAKRCWQGDQERRERPNMRADLIRCKNHFNFIKRCYLGHFASQVQRFGSISVYFTVIR